MTTELKPCPNPWCTDSKPVLMKGGWRGYYRRIQCKTCGAHHPASTEFEDDAVRLWNTRKATP